MSRLSVYLSPYQFERWQLYVGSVPRSITMSPPVGHSRSEYAARFAWLESEWHR